MSLLISTCHWFVIATMHLAAPEPVCNFQPAPDGGSILIIREGDDHHREISLPFEGTGADVSKGGTVAVYGLRTEGRDSHANMAIVSKNGAIIGRVELLRGPRTDARTNPPSPHLPLVKAVAVSDDDGVAAFVVTRGLLQSNKCVTPRASVWIFDLHSGQFIQHVVLSYDERFIQLDSIPETNLFLIWNSTSADTLEATLISPHDGVIHEWKEAIPARIVPTTRSPTHAQRIRDLSSTQIKENEVELRIGTDPALRLVPSHSRWILAPKE